VHEGVEADQVGQLEGGGPRPADGRTGEGVGLLDRQAHLLHHGDGGHHCVHADAVRDEVRSVQRDDHALAEAIAREGLDVGEHRGVGSGRRDQFEEAHVARRVEEVSTEEAGAQRLGQHLGHRGEREAGGVAREDGAPGDVRRRGLQHLLLDVEVFLHRLDHPVALGETRQIVLEIARLDEAEAVLGEEGGGTGLEQGLHRFAGEAVADLAVLERETGRALGVARLTGDDVEYQRGDSRVGEVGGDRAAHHPGSEDGHLADLPGHASSLVQLGVVQLLVVQLCVVQLNMNERSFIILRPIQRCVNAEHAACVP